MIEPILESFLHLTSCKIFLDFYSMACYSESNLYVSLFYIQLFSPSKVTIILISISLHDSLRVPDVSIFMQNKYFCNFSCNA